MNHEPHQRVLNSGVPRSSSGWEPGTPSSHAADSSVQRSDLVPGPGRYRTRCRHICSPCTVGSERAPTTSKTTIGPDDPARRVPPAVNLGPRLLGMKGGATRRQGRSSFIHRHSFCPAPSDASSFGRCDTHRTEYTIYGVCIVRSTISTLIDCAA